MRHRILALLILSVSATLLQAQPRLANWTETAGELGLGYPVPIPVDTPLPFDGFRTYNGLFTRHQDLMNTTDWVHGAEIGMSRAGRTIWAYRLGDDDRETIYGLPEPAMLTNGGIHAREWQSPEVLTGIMELLVDNAGDDYLYDYLLDNANITLIPVLNVDGFMQTQRFPDQSWLGTDPNDIPNDPVPSPRDGRMRRKNMLNVDEVIATQADHLSGVDLNRNNPPFWSFSSPNSSSPNPTSIVHHGASAHSEPETQALAAAALLGPEARLTMYTDVHSFSQVHFWNRTANQRLSANTIKVFNTFTNHHASFPAGKAYLFSTNTNAGIGTGIGSTDEFFSETYLIPAWTLEVEPTNTFTGGQDIFPNNPGCGADYGGFATNCHDGFILPDSQIRRVREQLAETFAGTYYQQAGPPSIAGVKLIDQQTQAVIFEAEWDTVSETERVLYSKQLQPMQLGRNYTFWMAFDKPMRWRSNGAVVPYPGQSGNTLNLNADVQVNGSSLTTITDNARWLNTLETATEAGYFRYRDDAVALDVTLPRNVTNINAVVGTETSTILASTFDMTGTQTDADPSTPAFWANGGWENYEDSNGVDGADAGGTDSSIQFQISSDAQAAPFTVEPGTSAAWYDTATSGQGFVIEILPDNRVVMYWFTYDENGDQAWYIGVGFVRGNRLIFSELIQPTGGKFGPDFDPDSVVRNVVGSASFLYEDCDNGTMVYQIGNRKGRLNLSRLSRVNGPRCGLFLGPPVPAEALQSGSWFDALQSGHGFTLEILAGNQDDALVYWFAYDSQGNQAWFFGTGNFEGEELVFTELFAPRGPKFGPDFNPDDLDLVPWGSARFTLNCLDGRMEFNSVIEEFGSGSHDLTRLSQLAELVCQE